jgi:hypothetical protein
MAKQEQKKPRRWVWFIIGLLVGLFFSGDIYSYKQCVKDCVADNKDCLKINSWYSNEDISHYDVNSCYKDLERCIDDCEE